MVVVLMAMIGVIRQARSLGIPPTCGTDEEKCDAFLWIKIPGESDGKCNGGPRAGLFWPEYADKLVNNTDWI